jgi:hypothetical protein
VGGRHVRHGPTLPDAARPSGDAAGRDGEVGDGDALGGEGLPALVRRHRPEEVHAERLLAGFGVPDAAAASLRRALALEPWHEETHRDLMAVLADAGRRSDALAQFAACRRLLADELGAEPAAETVGLAGRIRAGGVGASRGRGRGSSPSRLAQVGAPGQGTLSDAVARRHRGQHRLQGGLAGYR